MIPGKLPASRVKTGKIKVGYFPADFRQHPVSHLIIDLITLHDRSKFEIYGFSFGVNTNDPMRQRLAKAFDRFFDLRSLNDLEISQLSREQGVDIAIDLGGYTSDSRPKIFASRAAPIQINFLGFPGTTGSSVMDYFIGDQITITDDNREQFSEKIIFLPNSYQPNPRQRLLGTSKPRRSDYRLPERGFVFCCFNSSWKITPEVFMSWVLILKSVRDSVLWLSHTHPKATRNILAEFERNRIEASRIVFADRLPNLSDHLMRYQSADLFLDTFPYGAHTTASDALWAGLPVLTRPGKSFASRVAASLLHAMELPQLVTSTPEDYESLAIRLANDPVKMAELKIKISDSRFKTSLFDTSLYTHHIESAYQATYNRYHTGLPPDHIYIGLQGACGYTSAARE